MHDPLRKYRKQFRAWRNRLRLLKENRYYDSIFSAQDLSLPTDKTIRSHFAERFSGRKFPEKGRFRIIAIYRNYNWENASLKPALEKFGEVSHYDRFGNFEKGQNRKSGLPSPELQVDLINWVGSHVQSTGADFIFTYLSGEMVSPETARKLKAFNIPIINLSLNDKEAFVGKIRNRTASGVRDICSCFDISWTSTQDALNKYCVERAIPIYLPEGANPEIHKPYPEVRTIDLSFVGQCYGYRPEIIKKLELNGFHVKTYGTGWPGGPLSLGDMVRMYSRSKINLGFSSVAGHSDTYCLKGRDFEIPMSGGLYLTEYHPELDMFFDVEKEIVTYRNFEELVDKIKFLLSHPEQADMIRQNGYRRAQKEHSWEHRLDKILSLAGMLA